MTLAQTDVVGRVERRRASPRTQDRWVIVQYGPGPNAARSWCAGLYIRARSSSRKERHALCNRVAEGCGAASARRCCGVRSRHGCHADSGPGRQRAVVGRGGNRSCHRGGAAADPIHCMDDGTVHTAEVFNLPSAGAGQGRRSTVPVQCRGSRGSRAVSAADRRI